MEFPAQGYVNPINTTLEFDVTLFGYASTGSSIIRFQNNIQSTFARVRMMYGSTPLEDIIGYNQIVRNLTEWTATNQTNTMDQMSISEGVGGYCYAPLGNNTANGAMNVRQRYIQGIDGTSPTGCGIVPNASLNGITTPNGSATACTRRYQVNLANGLMTQDKLIPVKFMASQLAIEITLEQPDSCIFEVAKGTATGNAPTYVISNVNLIPEILEFDASYGKNFFYFIIKPFFLDAMFLRGLQEGGVPIKFSSWHTFQFTTGAASAVNLQVQERSRSVKALFCIQTLTPPTMTTDSHATYNSTTTAGGFLSNYQWRIGGR